MAHALHNAAYIAAAVSCTSIIAFVIASIDLIAYHPNLAATVVRGISFVSAVLFAMIASGLYAAQHRIER